MRALMSAIHAAAGNRNGVAEARRFRLIEAEKVVPRVEQVARRFGSADVETMFTTEQIRARQIELGLVS